MLIEGLLPGTREDVDHMSMALVGESVGKIRPAVVPALMPPSGSKIRPATSPEAGSEPDAVDDVAATWAII